MPPSPIVAPRTAFPLAALLLLTLAACGGGTDPVAPPPPQPPPAGISGVRIATGTGHTCTIARDDTTWCWGSNGRGKLGISNTTVATSPSPVRVTGSTVFTAIAAGADQTCGLTAAGAAWCWGFGGTGALGTGDRTDRSAPAPVAGGHSFSSLTSSKGLYMCGVRTDGAALCWGSNQFGVLGVSPSGGEFDLPQPVQGGHRFTQLAAGNDFSCGVRTDGQVLCWGNNGFGTLGRGTTGTGSPVPEPIAGGRQFVEVGVGRFHACARTAAGAVWWWGRNSFGTLGTADTVSRSSPAQVVGTAVYAALAVGDDHTCGLTSAGTTLCWGFGLRIGTTAAANSSTPQPVAGGLVTNEVAASSSHTCTRNSAGAVWCWGFNGLGRLGDGTTTERPEPVRVSGLP